MQEENQYYSYNSGDLPKGCEMCVRGEKVVLFVTGICPRKCYFCPLSDAKYGKDVSFANERSLQSSQDLIKEAEMMDAKGAGITGGDPLIKIERTLRYIKALKDHFGKEFHIHLYTSFNLVSEKNMQQLYQAGLDEIRFHPDLESTRFWKHILFARKFPWSMGIEVPLIPTKRKELKAMIDYFCDKVDFMNFNELERADNDLSKVDELGLKTIDQFSYAIEGSVELGLELMEYVKTKKGDLPVHVCTAKLKDATQLTNRLERESHGMKRDFDRVDDEGLLVRGALYLPDLSPGFGYRAKLAEMDKIPILDQLKVIEKKILNHIPLKENEYALDCEKPRILLGVKNLRVHKAFFHSLGLLTAIVKELPTADQLEIEVDFLE
ncbi:radical SAM protein [Candidatus Woesearchaeota archaeon]|nr:radical SAM protein [Candidatus Woesearchaeota archaeon]